jgi:hypothetical protein
MHHIFIRPIIIISMGADESKPDPKTAAAPKKSAAEAQAEKQIKIEKVTVNLDQNI